MRIRAGYEITYDCLATTPMVAMLSVRPERMADLITAQDMAVSPQVPLRAFRDGFGNVCHRLTAPKGRITLSADFLIADTGRPDPEDLEAEQHPVDQLPDAALQFLLGSRYCETDPLMDLAWEEFGRVRGGGRRVQAVVDYAHQRLEFGYHHARVDRTASDAHRDRKGVCRDFAHLAIALCRCLNIPARYCTGYLGDIGVEPVDLPMDFSAWFEAFIGGQWRTFDPRHNRPRIGRILQAHGRDATDVAFTTSFGRVELAGFKVITEEVA